MSLYGVNVARAVELVRIVCRQLDDVMQRNDLAQLSKEACYDAQSRYRWSMHENNTVIIRL